MTIKAFYAACQLAGLLATCFIGLNIYSLTGNIEFLWWFIPAIMLVHFGAFASRDKKRDEQE